ncbi:MAG: peptide chain release factor N(5)-glutamine methyltransferase, partial [Candidatus Komeilibacteria bacterium]|nr:peptide chain release factor N(5)-glutamine methyltransferase [Candidatus Komeilibacteria bacterium]
EIELLLGHVTKKSKEFVLAHPEHRLTAAQVKKFTGLRRRRELGEPLAYLLGRQEFFGLDFYVDRRVLIPRPETELLVEEVLNAAKELTIVKSAIDTTNKAATKMAANTATTAAAADRPLKILDIGTGSGCIAIALKKNLAPAEIMATDISADALTVARKNAQKNKVKISFIQSDLLAAFLLNKKNRRLADFDIITANLPYLAIVEKHPSIRFEPRTALYGGREGLFFYKKLFQQISRNVSAGGRKTKNRPLAGPSAKKPFPEKPKIFCEINPLFARQTLALAKKYFPARQITLKKDLAGFKRLLMIK